MFQFKTIVKMMNVVQARKDKEDGEQAALDDFYKPSQSEVQNESVKNVGGVPAGEVINFESLVNEEEDENFTGEQFLNPI
mmetsp:Transcript_19229/g.13903  ORF Transcript_19229/g.13903 Transcript_19229/m.13903 type:complete len:80 (+) Transcript_19229:179-418(+)